MQDDNDITIKPFNDAILEELEEEKQQQEQADIEIIDRVLDGLEVNNADPKATILKPQEVK